MEYSFRIFINGWLLYLFLKTGGEGGAVKQKNTSLFKYDTQRLINVLIGQRSDRLWLSTTTLLFFFFFLIYQVFRHLKIIKYMYYVCLLRGVRGGGDGKKRI